MVVFKVGDRVEVSYPWLSSQALTPNFIGVVVNPDYELGAFNPHFGKMYGVRLIEVVPEDIIANGSLRWARAMDCILVKSPDASLLAKEKQALEQDPTRKYRDQNLKAFFWGIKRE